MYKITKVEDTIRILPDKFGEDLDEVIKESVQNTFEGTVRKDHGIIVVAKNIKPIGDGIVIHSSRWGRRRQNTQKLPRPRSH